ncbi:MAG TPA: methylated-DNA--[protein]-cysteine S-methyltransferase [Rhabdochlamydiaceae bacterium]|nr:methylated-DNA--[protein]-cysteine S-methyltransferase [Rhabdochlamydiaceae bacterium]
MEIIALRPGIRVQIHFKGDSLERISLFSSPDFSLDCPIEPSGDQIAPFKAWLMAYSQGKNLPFSLPLGKSSFQGDVLRYLQTIPWGSVCSYQEVAKSVGNPRAARAVGNICRGNLFPLLIPCHRVIRSDGEIGRYTPDPSLKSKLLHFEGVTL